MLVWIKEHASLIAIVSVTIAFVVYCYGCEAKVKSLTDKPTLVNRQELQLELDQFITMAKIRMADLDKQEELRSIILQNALILVQGNPYNPIGIITAVAAIYGVTQGGKNVTKVVKNNRIKKKVDNG